MNITCHFLSSVFRESILTATILISFYLQGFGQNHLISQVFFDSIKTKFQTYDPYGFLEHNDTRSQALKYYQPIPTGNKVSQVLALTGHGEILPFNHLNNLGNNPLRLSYLPEIDSTSKKKWYKTDTGISLIVSAGFFGMSAFTFKDEGTFSRKKVRDEINRFLPNYENTVDDITQYIPYAATYAFDAFGIKSRHQLLRKTTTMATALLLNGVVVGTMKSVIDEERPDGSANNTFPSGHTTTAFMGAHIFHKEYRHISPYYSVAAYALASFTGVFRQLNNRHWVSDVMMGAGLGISLTELAYFINDKIYKEKGINVQPEYQQSVNEKHPSFLSATIGFAKLTDKFNNEETGLSSERGYVISAEGAYFFNEYLGIGGTIQGQSFPINISKEAQQNIVDEGYELVFQTLGSTNVLAGPYIQYPVGKNILGGKFLMGSLSGSDTKLTLRLEGSNNLTSEDEIIYADFSPNTTFAWSAGWYYKRLISKITALGIYGRYTNSDLEFGQNLLDRFENNEPVYVTGNRVTKKFNSYSIGFSLSVMLW